jgi:hypothetical protein
MGTSPGSVILPDVGIVASADPVACDQAAVDVIKKATGEDIKKAYPELDYNHQLAHAEKIGLGSRKYELITI